MRGKLLVAATALAVVTATATRISADNNGDANAEACTGQVIAALARGSADGTGKVTMSDLIISSVIRPACDAGESVEAVIQKVREAAGSQ
jgi:hypothetical protein